MSNLYFDAGPDRLLGLQKVMIATTVYQDPDASYTYSIAQSREHLSQSNIRSAYYLLSGNCHVDDARNTVVRDFLESDCTHLIFIDADVSWEPKDLLELARSPHPVTGGVYPYRREGGPNGPMPVSMKKGKYEVDFEGYLEVEGLPTGFMMIERNVLSALAMDAETFHKDPGKPIPIIFERDVVGGGRRGGDINFCAKAAAAGFGIYAIPHLTLGHSSKVTIRDSLAAFMRRQERRTLRHIRTGLELGPLSQDQYREALRYVDNWWGAQVDTLACAVEMARQANEPILELGSGLSTVLMACVTDQPIFCIEHDPKWALETERLARECGDGIAPKITMVNVPLVESENGQIWYDLSEDMAIFPDYFYMAFVDGPPRYCADRTAFFGHEVGRRSKHILIDDAEDRGYLDFVKDWAASNSRKVEVGEKRAAYVSPHMAPPQKLMKEKAS